MNPKHQLILELLNGGALFGRALRKRYNARCRWWRRKSLLGFYVMMSKMEDLRLVGKRMCDLGSEERGGYRAALYFIKE